MEALIEIREVVYYYRIIEIENSRSDKIFNVFPSIEFSEVKKIMIHFKCTFEEYKHFI